MLVKMCKEEFQVQYFKLDYETPEDFTRCWFQKRKEVLPIWVFYRIILLLYFFASHLYTIFAEGNPDLKYYIFLTNWAYLLQFYQTLIAVIITGQQFMTENRDQTEESMSHMPLMYKMYWAIFSINLPCSIIVTVVFWIAVYESKLFPLMARNILSHGVNSVLLIIDFLLVAHPVRLLHFYWPCLFGLLYTLFTVIYQLSGGTGTRGLIPIYKVLDWREPRKAILVVLIGFLLILVVHYLAWLISKLKFFLKKNIITTAA